MEKHTPDRLWKSLCEALEKDEEPDNELLKTVYGVLKGTIVNEEISTVLDLIHNTRYREELIIFFLSGASCEDISRSLKIPPVQLEIFRKSRQLLEKTEVSKRPVRLLGISLSRLIGPDDQAQISLFDQGADSTKGKKLNLALDSITEKYGDKAILPGTLIKK